MNWDSLCLFIVFAGSAYILLWFILIRPLNKRYKKALATSIVMNHVPPAEVPILLLEQFGLKIPH